MRVAKALTLTGEERTKLTKWSRGRSAPARLVMRAKIVLAAAEGRRNDEIAAAGKCTRRTVGVWRNRFVEQRLEGKEQDAPRGGALPRNVWPLKRKSFARRLKRHRRTPRSGPHARWPKRSAATTRWGLACGGTTD